MITNISLSNSFHTNLLTSLLLQINISSIYSSHLRSEVKKANFNPLLKNCDLALSEKYQYTQISDYGGMKKSMCASLCVVFIVILLINIGTLLFFIHQKKQRRMED